MRAFGLIWLLLAACSRAPEAGPAVQLKAAVSQAVEIDFAAYGDCRSGHATHRRICASMLRFGAKYVVVSGDLVDSGDDEEDWRIWRDVTQDLRATSVYLAAPGNHDISRDRAFERELGLERTWFDKRMGDVHLFLLDSNQDFEEAEQLAWLEKAASASDARHKIAAFHHSPFTLSTWGDLEERPIRARLHPLLVKLKFCAAFAGHHHAFYATKRDGLRYVVTAGGGAHLYRQNPERAIEGDLYRSFHHFVGCRIEAGGIRARVFDPDGVEAPELAFRLCEH